MTVSPNTIMRALKRHRIKSRYKKKCPQLSKSHHRARMAFERAHRLWQDDDWDKVVWSDETKICLFGSDGRERAFRKDGEPLRDHHVTPTKKFGGGSIMVWGCMLSSGVGYLCRIDGGVDAEMYESILSDELMETIQWYGLDKEEIIFQQDNASCHTASRIKKWFQTNGIKVMTWPAQSPDLNPIEHLWDHIKRKLKDLLPAGDLDQLWEQVQDIWNAIDKDTCFRLVRSMPKRLEAVRKAKGGYTSF
jgi:DDE superfamily endonuclease